MEPIIFHIMVPVYKVEPYLDECVQSVLDQSYQNFRLYLIDDGSPDRSGELCDAWAERDGRVRVLHKPNGGLMHTRRTAIALVHENVLGERDYGVFLDSDDTLRPCALETMAKRIREHSCDCLIFNAVRVLEGAEKEPVQPRVEAARVYTDRRELYDALLKDRHYNALWRKAVRMDRLGTWDFSPWYHISIGEDAIQSLEIYQNCQRIALTTEDLYNYRLNPASLTETDPMQGIFVDHEFYDVERTFLQREPAYAGAPFAAYRDVQIHGFTGNLVRIARLKRSRAEKTALYERIRGTAYWREFLDGGHYDRAELGKMALIYEAFRRRQYWFIFLMTTRLFEWLRRAARMGSK